MDDLVMEFFYDSSLTERWHVTVILDGEEQFQMSHSTWEGLMEDLRWKTPFELGDLTLSVGW